MSSVLGVSPLITHGQEVNHMTEKKLTNEERARIAEAAAGVKEIFKDQRKGKHLAADVEKDEK